MRLPARLVTPVAVLGFACAATPGVAEASCGAPVASGATETVTCTPGSGTVNVPDHVGGVVVLAGGGAGGTSPLQPFSGGPGSQQGTITESGPFSLDVLVGAAGGNATALAAGAGGAPGGGAGSVGPTESGGGGGGYTQVVDTTTSTTLMTVGGGGGSGGSNSALGAGGDGAGGDSTFYPDGRPGGGCIAPPQTSCAFVEGGGATTTAPGAGDTSGAVHGSAGLGSTGGDAGANSGGGGGGGGCFGGGGGGCFGGGGGGCFGGGGGGTDHSGAADNGGGGGGGSTCVDSSLTNRSEPALAGPDGTVTVTYTPPVAPSITSTGPAAFTIGAAGSYRITATGTPSPALSLDDPNDLPAGLTFTPGAGSATISGTPSGPARTVTVTVRAHGAGNDATQRLSIEIAGGTVSTGGGTVSAGGGVPPPPVTATTSPSGAPAVGVQLACTGAPSSSCEGQVALTTKVKHHKKPVVVGRATYTIQAGQVKIVKVTLNARGRKLLKKHHRLTVTVVIGVSTTNGLRQAASETITLKQHKHKK